MPTRQTKSDSCLINNRANTTHTHTLVTFPAARDRMCRIGSDCAVPNTVSRLFTIVCARKYTHVRVRYPKKIFRKMSQKTGNTKTAPAAKRKPIFFLPQHDLGRAFCYVGGRARYCCVCGAPKLFLLFLAARLTKYTHNDRVLLLCAYTEREKTNICAARSNCNYWPHRMCLEHDTDSMFPTI